MTRRAGGPTQPAPRRGTGDVWLELIAREPPGRVRDTMVARREFGIARYGTPLQRGNGRDAALDLREEVLDGLACAQTLNDRLAVRVLRWLLTYLVTRYPTGTGSR